MHKRSVGIIHKNLAKDALRKQTISTGQPENPEHDVEWDFTIVALDLLSSLAEGCGSAVESLVAPASSNIVDLLFHSVCTQYPTKVIYMAFFYLLPCSNF